MSIEELSGMSEDELKSKIATLESEKTNLVGELKEDRQKRQTLQEQIAELQGAVEEATRVRASAQPNGDIEVLVTEAVTKALKTSEASKAKENKETAFEKFVREHKEFSPENDVTGSRREALEAEFNTFNTANVSKLEDFEALIGKAHKLLGGDTTPATSGVRTQPYSSIPSSPYMPRTVVSDGISDREAKLIEMNGWTKERYIKLKEKMPENYIENLLKHVR